MDKGLVVIRIEVEGLFVAFLRLPGPPGRFVDQPQQAVHVGMGAMFLQILPANGRGLCNGEARQPKLFCVSIKISRR